MSKTIGRTRQKPADLLESTWELEVIVRVKNGVLPIFLMTARDAARRYGAGISWTAVHVGWFRTAGILEVTGTAKQIDTVMDDLRLLRRLV
jgi:hypothetical protein